MHAHAAGGPAGQVVPAARSTSAQKALRRQVHQTLAKVTDDIGRRRTFNTAIAAVMELLNALTRAEAATPADRAVVQEALELAVLMLSPIVPHICHRLWHVLGHDGAVIDERWPQPDPAALVADTREIVVQVNGKVRGRVTVPAAASEADVRAAALADENVQRFVGEPAGPQGHRRAREARECRRLTGPRAGWRLCSCLPPCCWWPVAASSFRGAPDLPPQMAVIHIQAADRYSPFYRELVTVLRRSDVTLTDDPTQARTVLNRRPQ